VNFEHAVKATKDLDAFIAQRPVKVATCSLPRAVISRKWLVCNGLAMDWRISGGRPSSCKTVSIIFAVSDLENPRLRRKVWLRKFKDNTERDRSNYKKLARLGWRIIIIWQCQTGSRDELTKSLKQYFVVDPKQKNKISVN
jgi:hypothetical protein